jgi:hypothetical protein
MLPRCNSFTIEEKLVRVILIEMKKPYAGMPPELHLVHHEFGSTFCSSGLWMKRRVVHKEDGHNL